MRDTTKAPINFTVRQELYCTWVWADEAEGNFIVGRWVLSMPHILELPEKEPVTTERATDEPRLEASVEIVWHGRWT